MARTRGAGAASANRRATHRSANNNPPAQAKRPSRAAKRRITSLRDISSDEDSLDDSDSPLESPDEGHETDDDSSADDDFEPPSARTRQSVSPRTLRQTTTQCTSPRRPPSSRSRQTARQSPAQSPVKSRSTPRKKPASTSTRSFKKRRTQSPAPKELVVQGNIPDWLDPRIPYRTWTDIFHYAAMEGGPENLNAHWLVSAATVTKALSESAISALYRSIHLTNTNKAKRLLLLLQRPESQTTFNYRAKIKTLYLDIHAIPQAFLPGLIHPLPRLREVFLFSQFDQPPYRQLDRPERWHYSEDIFQALGPADSSSELSNIKPFAARLRSWEWSGSLMRGSLKAESLKDIIRFHQNPSFVDLTTVSFTNFQVPSLYGPESGAANSGADLLDEDGAVIDVLASAINMLPNLKKLLFESSTAMCDRLLQQLPRNLTYLGLINCWEVRAEDLVAFLLTHGREMRTLDLLHNQSLDLSFLSSLADICPNLEELRMNLSYYRHHDARSLLRDDSDPLYEQSMLPDQVPKWPASIRLIDLEHIRHWTPEAAETMFKSLIDSAGDLPNLRHIAIKTMLNIPWKARAEMRHKWRGKLEEVFLRPYVPPRKHTSLRHEMKEEEEEQSATPQVRHRRQASSPQRRSGRIVAQALENASKTSSPRQRNKRVRPTYKEPDTDEEEFDSESDSEDDLQDGSEAESGEDTKPAIQGLCTTVEIIFDNQKPRELQYGMEDFMDDDLAESDEWDGQDHDDTGEVYVF